jgi:hypothetical protein
MALLARRHRCGEGPKVNCGHVLMQKITGRISKIAVDFATHPGSIE